MKTKKEKNLYYFIYDEDDANKNYVLDFSKKVFYCLGTGKIRLTTPNYFNEMYDVRKHTDFLYCFCRISKDKGQRESFYKYLPLVESILSIYGEKDFYFNYVLCRHFLEINNIDKKAKKEIDTIRKIRNEYHYDISTLRDIDWVYKDYLIMKKFNLNLNDLNPYTATMLKMTDLKEITYYYESGDLRKIIKMIENEHVFEILSPSTIKDMIRFYSDYCRRRNIPRDFRNFLQKCCDYKYIQKLSVKKMASNTNSCLEFENDKYKIIVPTCEKDFIREATHQHNCVYTSYYPKWVNGQAIIVFLREKNNLENSYITIELSTIDLRIVQAKEKYNYSIGYSHKNREEIKNFLDDYQKYLYEISLSFE